MRNYILTLIILLGTSITFAQTSPSPNAFKYQAVVRDLAGNPQNGIDVSFQVTLKKDSCTGNLVYQETFSVTTNNYGLVNLSIGNGNVTLGTFSTISWGSAYHYMDVEMDINGGVNFTPMSCTQLLSVPYALYAKESGSGPPGPTGPQGVAGIAGQNGLDGIDGQDGATGATGPQGIQGPTGPQGVAGIAGQNGIDGIDGLDGATGPTGPQGIQGPTGPQGADGADNAWSLIGNSGTDPTTNFLGTTDAQDLVFKTNNKEDVRINTNGNVGIGTATPNSKFHVIQSTSVSGVTVEHSGSTGNSINVSHNNSANNSSSIWLQNQSVGRGLNVTMNNTGDAYQGLYITQKGSGSFSRGVEMNLSDASNPALGLGIFHKGLGRGAYIDLENQANTSSGLSIYHKGLGRGAYIDLQNSNASTGLYIRQRGSGTYSRGVEMNLSDASNPALGLGIFHNGPGLGAYIDLQNSNAAQGVFINQKGTGTFSRGMEVNMNNTGDAKSGLFISQNGSGTFSRGIEVYMNNTGNAAAGLFIKQKGSGTNSHGIIVNLDNATNSNSRGIESYISISGNNDPRAIYGIASKSNNDHYGIGVWGSGGWYGVVGYELNSLGRAFFGYGDYAGTGAKLFSIDHPLDPENKILNHYSIESNEITNMYRGIVQLDANGVGVVELPDYFDAVNINPSYQLTAIGTPNQPYILSEIANNEFKVAGEPNTKVSWTVYAKRNDPTIRYLDAKGKNYDQEVIDKPERFRGKYYTPGAYNQPELKGIFYNPPIKKHQENQMLPEAKTPKIQISKPSPAHSETMNSENASHELEQGNEKE